MRYGRKYKVNKKRNLQKSWRSASKQNRSDLTRFLTILGAIIVVSLFSYFIGINGLTHIGGFWAAFTGEREQVAGDTIAPAPPTLEPLSPHTKSKSITIKGFAEPGSEVTVFVNEVQSGTATAEAGLGTFELSGITLKEGVNKITASAKDAAGNVSQKVATTNITLDTKPPKLEISLKDGQKISNKEGQITVSGTTEAGATVRINGSQTNAASGAFTKTFTAQPGQVLITVTSTDKAGNEEKIEIKVTLEKTE